jgi:hypothetical protein
VFHVAGTNGKGSTCTYLRFMLEAQGLRVHSATKPHLVRYNERIRIAGELISDEALADLLERVLDAAEGLGADFPQLLRGDHRRPAAGLCRNPRRRLRDRGRAWRASGRHQCFHQARRLRHRHAGHRP